MKKIAQYKSIRSDYVIICEVEDFYEQSDDYMRISEIVEVEFKPIPAEVQVSQEIERLDIFKSEVLAETQRRVNQIEERKQNLLALEFINPGHKDAD